MHIMTECRSPIQYDEGWAWLFI